MRWTVLVSLLLVPCDGFFQSVSPARKFSSGVRPAPLASTIIDQSSPPSQLMDVPATLVAGEDDDALAAYVAAKGGRRVIRKVLIANNGMAATKSIMSMRRWAYLELGDEKALSFVVMATPEDLNANAEFVRMADEYVEVPGGSNVNNYANVKLIVDVAKSSGVDAVWPGWGHASENPKLPTALKLAGIAFMGPTAPVMAVLGDKIAANILAQTAKVPSIPWSGSYGDGAADGPLQAELQADGTIPDATFRKACVTSVEEALFAAEKVGYPVMLKASEGGGGKGIRMNQNAEDIREHFQMVANEVPGSPIFIMQLMTGARHLEVQVVGDEHGNAIALSGRDCSTQRRFQKIFEEGPPTKPTGGIARPDVFADMELKAKMLVQSIGYVGAGTVEYLYDAKTDAYFFLELNPRLQVEHPVTEGVTGVNLPATQLQVAMGIPLHQLPEVRELYGIPRSDAATALDLDDPNVKYQLPKRHVLAARITAENPDEGFKPTSGKIERVSFQSTPQVWGYFSVGPNGGVHEYADSQFGHLFATGGDREEARKAMVLALKELKVRGEIRNPVEYLVQLLETDDFIANDIDTSWLDGLLKAKAISKELDDNVVVAAAALFRSHERCKQARVDFERNIMAGQFSTSQLDELDSFEVDFVLKNVRYAVNVRRTGEFSFIMSTKGGRSFECKTREQPDGTLLAVIDGETQQLTGLEEPLGLRLVIDGNTIFVPAAFDPSEVRSDVTGKLVRWVVEDGATVQKGATFAEVEAMKMIMPLRATETGAIQHNVGSGAVIAQGDLLASLELEDATKVKKIDAFPAGESLVFPWTSAGAAADTKLEVDALRAYYASLEALKKSLDGYAPARTAQQMASSLVAALGTPGVFRLAVRDVAGAIGQKMPALLDAQLAALTDEDGARRVEELLKISEDEDGDEAYAALAPLRALTAQWRDGARGVAIDALGALLTRFLDVEERFVGRANADAATREVVKTSATTQDAAAALVAHSKLKERCGVVASLLALLPDLATSLPSTMMDLDLTAGSRLQPQLERLAALEGADNDLYGAVAFAAGMARLGGDVPSVESRVKGLRAEVVEAMQSSDGILAVASSSLLGSYRRGVDLLTFLFDDEDRAVAVAAAEVYVRRMYSAHDVLYMDVNGDDGTLTATWWYKFRSDSPKDAPVRFGKLVLADDATAAVGQLSKTIAQYTSDYATSIATMGGLLGTAVPSEDVPTNTLHLMLRDARAYAEDASLISAFEDALATPETAQMVAKAGLRSVNVIATAAPAYPRLFTFVNPGCVAGSSSPASSGGGFKEDPLRRSMRPTFYHLLELSRASENFDLTPLSTINRDLQVYVGDEKDATNPRLASQCVFVRRVSHSTDLATGGAERLLDKALDALEMAHLDARVKSTSSGRLFFNVIPPLVQDDGSSMSPEELDGYFKSLLGSLLSKKAARLLHARVDEIEVKFVLPTAGDGAEAGAVKSMRCVASSASGPWLALNTYIEKVDPVTGVGEYFCDLAGDNCVVDPYPAADAVGRKRAAARRIGTTYAYDFVGLLATATAAQWRDRAEVVAKFGGAELAIPAVETMVAARELLLDPSAEHGVSTTMERAVGSNNIGMVAWECVFKTPEYPHGRPVVVVANDVTYKSGSFGVGEDDFFAKVSEHAAAKGVPRVYLSSNSGARIGLVEALKPVFGVKFTDANKPEAGFDYLYLTPEQLASMPEGAVEVDPLNADGVHAITAIIGSDEQVPDGIGVENLRGSGLIAGITSRAYESTFTLSYVSGRSVGIGAYLVRLGQRVIQMRQGPMILTGFEALNKLLGKAVYTSQDQLGGPQVMVPNGITHQSVDDDYEGARAIVDWLSYVPETAKSTQFQNAPALPVADPVDRLVTARPPADGSTYDVRTILDNADGTGLFDAGSFTETLAGWGKTVVAGRAKLGGIPFGVIAVETRTVEAVVPADPANPDSREAVLPQAGQVWFPDSAFKTAQAIEDFNKGEKLPLMILANWRGFSGGTRDMYGEVLKFGAKIVDALSDYDRPVFVYIPPKGELRGGAWVVVDPTINQDCMEMYADPESRGGILEPPGICEVKFRAPEQSKLMHRVDATLQALDALPKSPETDLKIATREKVLAPLYTQVAHEFADLHDRAGRMKAKGVIREVVAWEGARAYFYGRAKRRLAQDAVARTLVHVDASLSFQDATAAVANLVQADTEDDLAVATWLEQNQNEVQSLVKTQEKAGILLKLKSLLAGRDDAKALFDELSL